MDTLPLTARALPLTAGALPPSAGALPPSAGALPLTAGALPLGARALPLTAGALPLNARALPLSAGLLSARVDALPRGAVENHAVSVSAGKGQIDGARIRALRTAKMMTIPELASKAGVAARTLADLECGRKGARPDTIRCIAGALSVAPDELFVKAAVDRAAPPPSPKPSSPKLDIPPPKHPARTRLDGLADLVRARGISPAPIAVGKAKVAVLDPVAMQNLFARHAAFEGDSLVVCGRVERQRALSTAEARALQTRVGVGARYRVITDVVDGETLDVTVHAVDATLAGALQAKMGQPVRVVVRVRVVGKNDARVVSLFASARKRAWALVAVKMV